MGSSRTFFASPALRCVLCACRACLFFTVVILIILLQLKMLRSLVTRSRLLVRQGRQLVPRIQHIAACRTPTSVPAVNLRGVLVASIALTGMLLSCDLQNEMTDRGQSCNSFFAHCDSEPFTVKEVGRILREKLSPGREKLRKQGRPIPRISVRAIAFPDRNGRENETQVMDISFDQNSVKSITALISYWLDAMDDKQSAAIKREILQNFKNFYSNKKQLTLPIVSTDKSSSMTITKYLGQSDYDHHKQAAKLSISIFKDEGFGMKQLQSIVKGYEEGFDVDISAGSSNIKKGEDQGLVFGMDDEVENIFDAQNQLKSILEKFFASSTVNGGNDETPDGSFPWSSSALGRSERRSADATTIQDDLNNAVEGLRTMGVEVFDKESNEKFTWDFLAGYDHIKREIEDTVINSLKFPEIYDEIAQKTRLHFESNRPKAILFEGPPGTGKTLTARILASQVEAPLVVIKLESIVSKWYGDSEKKLSKILDYCDQMRNSIIFVDEIDALTQSRDSENGIHEVSKRILSILLQRLEGFHGKSKSLLICTTNRKQDLDRALISRFDLVIPYDLPDLNTRMEIFRRYAKQFTDQGTVVGSSNESKNNENKNQSDGISIHPYEKLGQASEGLSCRDLKEICEYAERKCASRLVKYKQQQHKSVDAEDKTKQRSWWSKSEDGKKSDSPAPPSLPTIEDYLESIRIRTVERRSFSGKFGNHSEPYSSV